MTAKTTASRVRSTVFAPLIEHGRATLVEQRLGDAIRSGLLTDGERLPRESELAQLLGVATVTAREALGNLRAQGLVTTVRGRHGGSYVTRPASIDDTNLNHRLTSLSRFELYDLGAVYTLHFAGVAELAAERANAIDAEDLRMVLVAPQELELVAWRQSESELALAMAGVTQSARVAQEMVRLEADFGALLRLPLIDSSRRSATRERQSAIVEAVASNQATRARTRAREHSRASLAALAEHQASLL